MRNPGDDNLRALERAALASPGDVATQQAYVTAALRARTPISTFVLANMARMQRASLVFKPNGKVVKVKNLGWLLKHAGKNLISLVEIVGGPSRHGGAELVVRFDDGTVFVSDFASLVVLWGFLDRPVFHGAPAVIHDGRTGEALRGVVTKGQIGRPAGQWAPEPPTDELRLRENPDEGRRSRERRARAEGGVAGEVARLTDEIRAGRLPPDRVMYAGVLGDEAARATVPDLVAAWLANGDGELARAQEVGNDAWARAVLVGSVADSLRWVPWGREVADAAWGRSLDRVNGVVSPHVDEARIPADRSVVAMTQQNYGEALNQAAYAFAVIVGEQDAVSWRGASLEEITRQRDDLVALLLQRPLPPVVASNPPELPASRDRFLPALATPGRLPRGEYVPPVTSFELATSGAVPLVYVPEGSYENEKANAALSALITTPGALAAPSAWDDLIARVGTRGTVYLIDRRGEQWRVRDVVYYPGGRDGALDVEHLGRRGKMRVDLREAYGHVLPVLVYKPLRANPRRNPPRGDERLRDLYRAIEAGAPLGDFSAFPALMTELQRAGRLAPWGADYGVLLLWQGPVTGTDVESLPLLGQTVEATAVIQPRVGAGGWADPRVDVLIPVTGARGPGWARPWQAAGVPAWVTALESAPRLLPKPPRAKRKRA